jgi:hypothetical protein
MSLAQQKYWTQSRPAYALMRNRKNYICVLLLVVGFAECEKPQGSSNIGKEPVLMSQPSTLRLPLQYVRPHNGLVLRKEDRAQSKQLRILPYATAVGEPIQKGRCEKIDQLEGCWYKFKVNGDTGWLFGGYLVTYAPRPIRSQFDALSAKYCVGAGNFCECASKIEAVQLKTKETARRTGRTLIVKLASGKAVELKDALDKYTSYIEKGYRYQSRIGQYFVFQLCQHEVGEAAIMNAQTGEIVTVLNEPVFSPSDKYFATYAFRPMFGRDGVEIFQISGTKQKKVFEDSGREWNVENLQWVDDDTIALTVRFLYQGNPEEQTRLLHIRNRDGIWKIDR